MKEFLKTVNDKEKGKHYRLYAGLKNNIPCEGTFTHYKNRLGEKRYNDIFHVLVEMVDLLGLISYKILTTDGTLFHTNPRSEKVTAAALKERGYDSQICQRTPWPPGILSAITRRYPKQQRAFDLLITIGA